MRFGFYLVISLVLTGCGMIGSAVIGTAISPAEPPVVHWDLGPAAVSLQIEASPRLNEFGTTVHAVTVAVFQANTAQALSSLFASADAAARLLETGKGGTGILSVERFPVEPGTAVHVTLDRVEGARYVGILAGYYDLRSGAVRLFQIPVREREEGVIFRKKFSEPASVAISVSLGRSSIESARLVRREPQDDAVAIAAKESGGMLPSVVAVSSQVFVPSLGDAAGPLLDVQMERGQGK